MSHVIYNIKTVNESLYTCFNKNFAYMPMLLVAILWFLLKIWHTLSSQDAFQNKGHCQ